MATCYIVKEGERCEQSFNKGVFSTLEDARAYAVELVAKRERQWNVEWVKKDGRDMWECDIMYILIESHTIDAHVPLLTKGVN